MDQETPDQLIQNAFKQTNREILHTLNHIINKNFLQLTQLNEELMAKHATSEEIALRFSRVHLIFTVRLICFQLTFNNKPDHPLLPFIEKAMKELGYTRKIKEMVDKEIKEINNHLNKCEWEG